MTTAPSRPVPDRSKSTWFGLALPLILLGACAGIVSGWRADLPDPIATHWGSRGPDGFGSLTGTIAFSLALGAGLVIAFWAVGFWWGRSSSVRRMANGTSVWSAVLMGGVLVATTEPQRGLADAADVGDVSGRIVLVLVLATVLGLAVAWFTPGDARQRAHEGPDDAAPRLPLANAEQAAWFGRATSRPGLLVSGVTILSVVVLAVVLEQWWFLVIAVVLGLVTASMLSFRVRIGSGGVWVSSSVGLPRTHLRAEEIVSARSTEVSALKEFGGWGWRVGKNGRTGVVLNDGEALEVTMSGGRVFVVTIPDADRAAALVNSLVDRARRG